MKKEKRRTADRGSGSGQAAVFRVPYGTTALEFSLPTGVQATVLSPRPAVPLPDPAGAVAEALAHPLGSPPLRELAAPGKRACIVYTDSTRACPDGLLVPALLEELRQAGVREDDITLLCATGLHRPSTPSEKAARLGADIARRFRVIDNSPQDPSSLVDLGVTPGGAPVHVHRAAVEADVLSATGIVEPHQFAGYSGGPKTLAIGAAGEASIAHTHSPAFVDHPGCRLGAVEGNPFHAAVAEAARRAGLRFILNVVMDDRQRILRVRAGDPELAYRDLVDFARSVYEVPIPGPVDVVIAGVGSPKDANLYQASRAVTYLALCEPPILRPGGFLIVPARCPEGAGAGVGDQRFLAAMREAPDLQSVLDRSRRSGHLPGEQRAFFLAKALQRARVVIVGSEFPGLVADCKMIAAATMAEALGMVFDALGENCRALIVPHALLTLPVVTSAL